MPVIKVAITEIKSIGEETRESGMGIDGKRTFSAKKGHFLQKSLKTDERNLLLSLKNINN